jgi:serine/threonine-protein phosphatase 4 regulatory subunit 1
MMKIMVMINLYSDKKLSPVHKIALFLGKKLSNSLNFWRTLSFEIDLQVVQAQPVDLLSPESPEEAFNVPVTVSSNIIMATRKEVEELIKNLQPHIDDTDIKVQVEMQSHVL